MCIFAFRTRCKTYYKCLKFFKMPLKLKRHMNIRCAFNESVLIFSNEECSGESHYNAMLSWCLVYWYIIYVSMIYLVFDMKRSVIALSWPTTGILLVCLFFQERFYHCSSNMCHLLGVFCRLRALYFPVIVNFCISKLILKKNYVCAILDNFGLLN